MASQLFLFHCLVHVPRICKRHISHKPFLSSISFHCLLCVPRLSSRSHFQWSFLSSILYFSYFVSVTAVYMLTWWYAFLVPTQKWVRYSQDISYVHCNNCKPFLDQWRSPTSVQMFNFLSAIIKEWQNVLLIWISKGMNNKTLKVFIREKWPFSHLTFYW